MKYNEFTQTIADAFTNNGAQYFPSFGNITVALQEITKANDDHRIGLLITREGNKTVPTIYLENFWNMYQNGEDMEYILNQIADIRIKSDIPDIDPSIIADLSMVRDKITCKVLNIRINGTYLANKPYSKISDLAVVYVVDLGNDMTVAITHDILKQYGITKETLHKIAMKNLAKSTVNFKTMAEMLLEMGAPKELINESDSGNMMYVLTNKVGKFGANLILDKATMNMVSQKLGGDFIIIPSSIHEVIILPVSVGTEGLTGMIGSVNLENLAASDVLSTHPYIYSAETKKIRSVA